jgi:hypothetical protein
MGRICLANLKQLNHQDHEDRKEKSLRGLCGLSRNFIWEGTKFTMSSPCIHFIFTFGRENQKLLISINDAPSKELSGNVPKPRSGARQ